jgi:prepilin-type N-terminal cleavage/methylation domain-containing protein
MKNMRLRSGFSLVEVVVAVGIFAVAIVGVIGLFGPTTKNVAAVADADASTRAVGAIQLYLKEQGFANTQTLIKNGTLYYASRGGDKVGPYDEKTFPHSENFFGFTLMRNTGLSPSETSDATAGYLAFTVSVKWPYYLPNATKDTLPLDSSQQSTLVIPMAVTR